MRSPVSVFLLAFLLSTGCSKKEEPAATPPAPEKPAVSAAPAPPVAPPPAPEKPVPPPPPVAPAPVAPPVVAAPSPAPVVAAAPSLASLSQDQVTRGLKEALAVGLQRAVASLGAPGGFLTNLSVKIPMPEKLQTLEKTLRSLRQDRLADEFVTTMNAAAERAVPAAAGVFASSLQRMTVEDARAILSGPADSATQYFRKANAAELTEKFLPIVREATGKSGATAAFKQLMDKASMAGPFAKVPTVDLDAYVTDKALDGLFTLVAAEEKRIRENPVARGTELLKSVFGALKK